MANYIDLKDNMESYVDWLKTLNLSTRTVESLIKLSAKIAHEIPSFSYDAVYSYIDNKAREGSRNSTINNYIQAIRHIGKYFANTSLINFKHYPSQETLNDTKIMSLEDVYIFINTERPFRKAIKTWDDWMLFFRICAYTGTPLKTISKIKKSHINIAKQLINIPDTTKTIPIPAVLKSDMVDKTRTVKGDYIFLTQRHKLFSDESWVRAFSLVLNASGLLRKGYKPVSLQITAQNRAKEVEQLLLKHYMTRQTANHNMFKNFKYPPEL